MSRTRGGAVGRTPFRGLGRSSASDKAASSYRGRLDARLRGGRSVGKGRDDGRSGRDRTGRSRGTGSSAIDSGRGRGNRTTGSTRDGGRGAIVGDRRTGVAASPGRDRAGAQANRSSRGEGGVSNNSGQRRSGDGGYHHGGHHHHYHDHHYFHIGLGAFAFGYGLGYGSYSYPYWWSHRYYYSAYCSSYYYPYYGSSHYPYYFSRHYYPYYRRYVHAYAYGADESYADDTYLGGVSGTAPAPLGSDDPYADPGLPSSRPSTAPTSTSTESALRPVGTEPVLTRPLVAGVDAGRTAQQALDTGDRLMHEGTPLRAAEAYRQAFERNARGDAILRMSAALLEAKDYPLASWAMAYGVDGAHRRLLDYSVLLEALLGGRRISAAISDLERYLVANPNDEASNLLLGALYTYTGRPYAARLVLDRLDAAGYDLKTTRLFIDHVKRSSK